MTPRWPLTSNPHMTPPKDHCDQVWWMSVHFWWKEALYLSIFCNNDLKWPLDDLWPLTPEDLICSLHKDHYNKVWWIPIHLYGKWSISTIFEQWPLDDLWHVAHNPSSNLIWLFPRRIYGAKMNTQAYFNLKLSRFLASVTDRLTDWRTDRRTDGLTDGHMLFL